MLWAQALDLRSDLTRLAERHPGLAERLERIRTVLDSPVSQEAPLPEPAGGSMSAEGRARQQQDTINLRRRYAREWDNVLAHVRALDGFEHFLAATPYPDWPPRQRTDLS